MTPDRKKPGVAFWATVVVVVGAALIVYALLPGPAVYLWKATGWQVPQPVRGVVNFPIRVFKSGPDWMATAYGSYLEWWLSLAD
jgi:hypothetical protein